MDHFVDGTSILPWAVLGASLLGSLHCVGMCGAFVATLKAKPEELTAYHLGRLAGYVSLGALAGLFGSKILSNESTDVLSWIAAVVMGLVFVFMGVNAWRGRGLHLFRLPPALQRSLFWKVDGRPLLMGLATALLPCGWLHGFVLAAVATRSAASGAFFLLLFWMGTLPALTAAPVILKRLLGPLTRRAPRMVGVLLITAGLVNIGAKMSTIGKDGKSCHEEASTQQAQSSHANHHHHH